MSDHRNHRHRASEPAWPTGEDPAPRPSAKGEERTGFWSPLWEDDDDAPARPPNGHGRRAQPQQSNGHARHDGGDAGAHRWPEAEPPPAPRRAEPPAPPRPAPRRGGGNRAAGGAAPVWPSAEEAPSPQGQRRGPGGPHTPPPPGRGVAGPGAGPTTRVARPRPAGPPRPGAGRPGVDPDGPTEMMRPTYQGTGPEPQLLTHREPDYDEDLHDDPDLGYEDDDDRPLSADDRKWRRRKVWRRVRRTMYVLTALGIIGPIVAFFVAYQVVDVPTPESVAADQGQVVRLTYTDGTQLSEIVPRTGNRTFVKYSELPDVVKHAVFAAEDATFMENAGFDITGVIRAGWNQVSGGAGGGSTITQQYIKQATGDDDVSLTRKATEIVKAYKMNNQYDKEDILAAYLNTIYFGRSAYGIVAASKAYYGKELKDLNASEAALLAGMIQLPGRDKDEAYQRKRWNFVMNQMVDKGWLEAEARKAAGFPTMIPYDQARPRAIEGPGAHIQSAVLKEVKTKTGMDLNALQQGGYKIETTINPKAQNAAQGAIDAFMAGQPPNLLPALVAVDPKTGEVLAYWGGANGNGLDWAATPQEPGSSFKAFDLVALLQDGKGLGEKYDGTSGRVFQGQKINNAGESSSCGKECTVKKAMELSVNTVFYDIALNTVGTQAVADAAKEAGVRSNLQGENGGPPDGNIAIGGGLTRASTYEMASAYATFAANGIYREPHLVKRILNPDGSVYWTPNQQAIEGKPAFSDNAATSQKIARNVTESLMPVLDHAKLKCAEKRLCAGKTGTHQFGETLDNAKSWMVGYTPSVSAAVSLAAEENGRQVPLKDKNGKVLFGANGSGKIWQKFMNDYLKGTPKETFGKFVPIGKVADESDDEDDNKNNDNRSSSSQTSTTTTTTTENSQETTTDEETSTPDDPESGIIPPIGGNNGGNGGGGGGGGNNNFRSTG